MKKYLLLTLRIILIYTFYNLYNFYSWFQDNIFAVIKTNKLRPDFKLLKRQFFSYC